ncbi:MAG: hypothetical protein DMG96_39925, partial [Acidobacteria bacterium]
KGRVDNFCSVDRDESTGARREGNQGAMRGRLSGSQQQKEAERDIKTKKHRLGFIIQFEKPLGIHRSVYSG